MRIALLAGALSVAGLGSGCVTIDTGHLGVVLHGLSGVVEHDPLKPGIHYVGVTGHVDDFDVTFSTRKEDIQTTSSEQLNLKLRIAVSYRPIASELYNLASEVGLNYYDEVIGPEFRSAARGTFARHAYGELLRNNEGIENEIESDLRRRTAGKHVEIASVTMESVEYAPEIGREVQAKLVAEQEAARQKTLIETEGTRRRLELQIQQEQAKSASDAALRQKQQETELAKEQAALDKIREESEAAKHLIDARSQAEIGKVNAEAAADELKVKAQAEAEEIKVRSAAEAEHAKLLAQAHAEENRSLTALSVMQHGYDALKTLGEKNTHIMIGDWSKVPNFLFPTGFQSLANPPAVQTAEHR